MRRRNAERGVTIVEAAVIIMLLFTLLFACIEFGRAYNIAQTITSASREGARYSVAPMPGTNTLPTNDQVQDWVEHFLTAANINDATVNVNQTFNGPQVAGTDIVYTEVNVTAPYQFLLFPFGTVNINTQARMRNETN